MGTTVTMKEIAQLAHVSTATVSRIINQNGRYSKETEERVLRLIKEKQYAPNQTAKGLRTRRVQTVGVLVPDITNPHFARLVQSIQSQLFDLGYTCIICNTGEQMEMEEKLLYALRHQNVCGFIMISSKRFHKSLCSLPAVYVDRPAQEGDENIGVTIESDNVHGGFLAGQQLVLAGCRKIIVMRTYSQDVNQEHRYRGFLHAMEKYGIREAEYEVVHLEDVSIKTAYSAMSDYLQKHSFSDSSRSVDGIMTTTDSMAAGVFCALREAGVRVPEDVKLTGFDDSDIAQICGPGITSIHQDVQQMAKLAVKTLISQMNGVEPLTHHYLLPVSANVRASTTSFSAIERMRG